MRFAPQEESAAHASSGAALWSAVRGLLSKVRIQKKRHSLRIEETLPLGEKRFLAVVQWESEKLLVGVTPQSITLLEPHTKPKARPFSWEGEPGA